MSKDFSLFTLIMLKVSNVGSENDTKSLYSEAVAVGGGPKEYWKKNDLHYEMLRLGGLVTTR